MCLMTQFGGGKRNLSSGVESIKNAPKLGRPKNLHLVKKIVSKIKEIIEGDARFTVS